MDDREFRQLLNYLDLSWNGYRRVRKGVKKRLRRHMQELGCRKMEAYIAALDQRSEAEKACRRLMTVSISRFFRDRALWHALRNVTLPAVVRENEDGVRVLSAGCARGEEVFSLKILWHEASRFQTMPVLEMWAVDMNPLYLEKARAGRYSRSSLKEVPEALQARYFRAGRRGRTYHVVKALKTGINWAAHDLLNASLGINFQIIFLRNSVLTYYNEPLRNLAFRRVLACLDPGGFLIIGTHEKIPPGDTQLAPLACHPCIFRKEP